MRKIYIAGKISGECETQELMQKCIDKFNNYGKTLSFGRFSLRTIGMFLESENISFTHGFIINRFLIPNGTWEQYMRADLIILLQCDEIHMLPDWKDSKGAKIEHQLALDLGIKIIYVK